MTDKDNTEVSEESDEEFTRSITPHQPHPLFTKLQIARATFYFAATTLMAFSLYARYRDETETRSDVAEFFAFVAFIITSWLQIPKRGCNLIKVSSPPSVATLDTLPTRSTRAYVCVYDEWHHYYSALSCQYPRKRMHAGND